MDYVVLCFTNKVCGYAATYLRVLASSAFGALWAMLVLLSEGYVRNVLHICAYFPVSFVCVRIISGVRHIRGNVRGVLVMYATSAMLYGAWQAIVMFPSKGAVMCVRILSQTELIACLLLSIVLVQVCLRKIMVRLRMRSFLAKAQISVAGDTFETEAYIDTGNQLRDPYSGKPVCVIDRKVLPEHINIGIDEKIHYIPISTVGCGNGVIQVFTAGSCRIYSERIDITREDILIGISENAVSHSGDFFMLINPGVLE